MASINLTIKSNFEQASKEIKGYSELTERELKRIKTALGKIKGDEIDSFIQKNQRAATAVTATRGKVEGLATEQAGLRREIEKLIRNGMDPQEEQMQKLRKEYERVNREIEIQNRALAANGKATKIATQGLKMMAVAAVAAGAAGTKMAMDYTKSLANVNTMIGITTDEMESLDDSITAVSNELAIQKTELSAGVYQALSAGAEDLGAAMDIVEASAKLGTGALVETANSVDIITTAMNAYSNEALTAGEVSDTYFQIIKKGKINGEQLSATIGQSISLFAAAKIPIDELGAGIASLTKVGVQASESTTQLNGVVNAFLKPSASMAAAIEEAGFASGAALLEQEGLAGAIEFLNDATGGNIDKMAELVPNIRGMRGAVALAANDMAVFNEVNESFADKAGATDEAVRRQTEGFAENAFSVEQSIVAVKNLAIELGQILLPIIGRAASAFTNFVTDGEKMKRMLNVILPIIGGIAAGFASFLIITKVIAVIRGLSTAMAVLNAVLAANPVILIAAGIAAVVAAIIILIRNWDKVVVFMETTIAKLQARWEQFGVALGSTWTRAINNLKVVFLELGGIILEKVLGAVNKLLDLASRIPVIGEKFAGLQDNVNGFAASLDEARQNAIANSQAVIENAKLEQAAAKDKADMTIAQIKRESDARMSSLREQQAEAAGIQTEINAAEIEAIQEQEELKTEVEAAALTERLAVLHDLEAQAQLDNMATFQEFLEARMEQEGIASEQKIAFLQSELERINELEGISNAERLAASKQVESMITAEQQKQYETRKALAEKTVSAYSGMFGSIGELIEAFAGDNREAAVAAKVLAMAQAGINSALAFTQVIADPTLPTFIKIPAAVGVLASGIAQQVQIANTPIPTAQTGTGMSGVTVPGNGQDQIGVMMAPGETAHISPRGENGGKPMHLTVQIDRTAIIDEIINPAIESQDIRITTDNIQGGAVVA